MDLFIAAAVASALSVGICVLLGISVSYPVAGSTVTTLFGSIALILTAIRLLNPPGTGLDLEFGAWLGVIAAAGVTVGGYLGMQEVGGRQAAHSAG